MGIINDEFDAHLLDELGDYIEDEFEEFIDRPIFSITIVSAKDDIIVTEPEETELIIID